MLAVGMVAQRLFVWVDKVFVNEAHRHDLVDLEDEVDGGLLSRIAFCLAVFKMSMATAAFFLMVSMRGVADGRA